MSADLVQVKTIVRAVQVDLRRTLNLGPMATLAMLVPDPTLGLRAVVTIAKNWARLPSGDNERGGGQTLAFEVVDVLDGLADYMRQVKFVRVTLSNSNDLNGEEITVNKVDWPVHDKARVYIVNATRRVHKKTFLDQSK